MPGQEDEGRRGQGSGGMPRTGFYPYGYIHFFTEMQGPISTAEYLVLSFITMQSEPFTCTWHGYK